LWGCMAERDDNVKDYPTMGDAPDDVIAALKAHEVLIARLKKALSVYKTDKHRGHCIALYATQTYLRETGVPTELLFPLLHLLGETDPKIPGSTKPINEAMIMATAAAAVTLGSPDGTKDQVEEACEYVAGEMHKAGFRVTRRGQRVEWVWKSLKEHRHNLINERASDIGIAMYQQGISDEGQNTLTAKQKMEEALHSIRAFM